MRGSVVRSRPRRERRGASVVMKGVASGSLALSLFMELSRSCSDSMPGMTAEKERCLVAEWPFWFRRFPVDYRVG